MPLPDAVGKLVARFEERREEYETPSYSEAQLRVDFLNPLFAALGWDVTNTKNLGPGEREVVTEPRQKKDDGGIEFPDYPFGRTERRSSPLRRRSLRST
jgi:hypothetical protein